MVGPAGRSAARPSPSRRTVLQLGWSLLVLAPVLAACSNSSDVASEANAGYVSGDGVVVEIPPEGRADPLAIQGTTYDGDDFDSTALRGAPLVLNIWYASCPPCRLEAPALKAVHSEYNARGVAFMGVNTRDQAGPAAAFETTFGITYPSIPDPDGVVISSMDGSVSPNAVPTTLILDAEGRVAARITGAANQSTLESLLDTVLAEAA
ncbi:TlpA disulfide reductase family protein [uncultured Brachybacterium sp.]|uniref:TlpA family protein disulfide reductase n=2 Tax=Dermabacteraceae TaxID=85020 RepID=UPI002605E5AB|nr:TlpA disulfide reductase family protein [uncultured Brachybacterium sp.]